MLILGVASGMVGPAVGPNTIGHPISAVLALTELCDGDQSVVLPDQPSTQEHREASNDQ